MVPAIALLLLMGGYAFAQGEGRGTELPKGKSSIKPFHIVGNIYYVGLNDNTSYLITTPQGNILLDTTYESGVPYIRKNIEELGFKVKDIKFILNAHAHTDHVGGLAQFKELTGAKVLAMPGDAPVLLDGGKSDFRSDGREQWTSVKADQLLKDGQEIKLGGTTMVAHLTAGHTKGCTTWTMVAEEGGKKYNVVFVCSMGLGANVPLINNAKYPSIADDYMASFKLLKSLPVDIFLGSHGSFYHMLDKIKRMEAGEGLKAFIDPEGYKEWIATTEKLFQAELAKQKGGAPPTGRTGG